MNEQDTKEIIAKLKQEFIDKLNIVRSSYNGTQFHTYLETEIATGKINTVKNIKDAIKQMDDFFNQSVTPDNSELVNKLLNDEQMSSTEPRSILDNNNNSNPLDELFNEANDNIERPEDYVYSNEEVEEITEEITEPDNEELLHHLSNTTSQASRMPDLNEKSSDDNNLTEVDTIEDNEQSTENNEVEQNEQEHSEDTTDSTTQNDLTNDPIDQEQGNIEGLNESGEIDDDLLPIKSIKVKKPKTLFGRVFNFVFLFLFIPIIVLYTIFYGIIGTTHVMDCTHDTDQVTNPNITLVYNQVKIIGYYYDGMYLDDEEFYRDELRSASGNMENYVASFEIAAEDVNYTCHTNYIPHLDIPIVRDIEDPFIQIPFPIGVPFIS